MFPYAMVRNPSGTWTLLNRNYKPLGTTTKDHVEYDDLNHSLKLSDAAISKLPLYNPGTAAEDTRYFYSSDEHPFNSKQDMEQYLSLLAQLMKLTVKD